MKRNNNLTRQQILRSLKDGQEILRKYKVRRIGLFGSYATGKQTPSSDIDFLVDFEEPTFDNFMGLNSHLERLLSRSRSGGMKSNEVFLRHVLDEITFLLEHTRGLSFDDFMEDAVLKRACARSFEIMVKP